MRRRTSTRRWRRSGWADEIVVVDSGSTRRHRRDRAPAHCPRDRPRLAGLRRAEELRRRAGLARLDPVARRRRARHAGAGGGDPGAAGGRTRRRAAYRIPRVSCYLGRWIRSTDWYPDYQLRLYDRRAARWGGDARARGRRGARARWAGCGTTCSTSRTATSRTTSQTIDRYTTLAARQMHEAGRRVGAAGPPGPGPPAAFLRNYLLRGGFRDGGRGPRRLGAERYYVFLKFAKLWELRRTSGREVEAARCSRSTSTPRAAGAAARTRSC